MKKKKRGITKVPNIRYADRNKFAFGAVLQVHGINYYVSVSSFDKKQEANILIRIPGDKKEVKGSLRFNYMIPVPNECIERLVIKLIILLKKSFRIESFFEQNHPAVKPDSTSKSPPKILRAKDVTCFGYSNNFARSCFIGQKNNL